MSTDQINTDAIAKFVDDLLKDDNINLTLVPDSIEKRVYMRLFVMVLSGIKEGLEEVHLDIMGHRITLHIEPIPETEDV